MTINHLTLSMLIPRLIACVTTAKALIPTSNSGAWVPRETINCAPTITYRRFDNQGTGMKFLWGAQFIVSMRFEMEAVMTMGRDDWKCGRDKMHCVEK
jgi:hypothetical protein